MDIKEVFIWFCHKEKIIESLYFLYFNTDFFKKLAFKDGNLVYKRESVDEKIKRFLNVRFLTNHFSIKKMFMNTPYSHNLNFRNLDKRWNYFIKNNINFSDDFIKIGDKISFEHGIEYTVLEIPKKFNGVINLISDNGILFPFHILIKRKFKINGEEKEIKFQINKKGKCYGNN